MLRYIFSALGALVVFGGLLALVGAVAYHVERRWK